MDLKVRDRVIVLDSVGSPLGVGTIVNINNFREPSHKYAVNVDGYSEDVLFVGLNQLVKQEGDLNE